MKLPSMMTSKILLATTLATVSAAVARADVVMDWNAKADAIAAEKQVLPAQHSRTLSILHVAMFEAVNAIERRYAPYKLTLSADRSTSKEAAAAVAAYDVLLAIYPDQKPGLDAAMTASLSGIAETESRSNGIELGKKAAAGVIAFRTNDGSAAQESYRPYAKPGVYVPTTMPLFSTVGATSPWVMTSGSHGLKTLTRFVKLAAVAAPSAPQSRLRSGGFGSLQGPAPTIQSSGKPRRPRTWMWLIALACSRLRPSPAMMLLSQCTMRSSITICGDQLRQSVTRILR